MQERTRSWYGCRVQCSGNQWVVQPAIWVVPTGAPAPGEVVALDDSAIHAVKAVVTNAAAGEVLILTDIRGRGWPMAQRLLRVVSLAVET